MGSLLGHVWCSGPLEHHLHSVLQPIILLSIWLGNWLASQTPNASRQGRHPPLFSAPAMQFACSHCLFVPCYPTCWLGTWLVHTMPGQTACQPCFPQTCKFLSINHWLFAWAPHNWPCIFWCVALVSKVAHRTLPQVTPPLCVASRAWSYVLFCTSQHISVAYLEHPAPLQWAWQLHAQLVGTSWD